jgi:L,D-transpeptidase catalytic domain
MSNLEFDGDELRLSLIDQSGKRIGSWPASNFGGPKSDFRSDINEAFVTWIPDGTYPFDPPSRHLPQRHSRKPGGDTRDGPYGTLGILRLAPIHYGGQTHGGVGIHAGREHQKDSRVISRKPLMRGHYGGAYYRTNGCIRTTEAAMHAIAAAIAKDPLVDLIVKNNGAHPTGKEQGKKAARLSP